MKVPLTFGPEPRNKRASRRFTRTECPCRIMLMMTRGLMWWTLGIPLPVITAVYLFHVL